MVGGVVRGAGDPTATSIPADAAVGQAPWRHRTAVTLGREHARGPGFLSEPRSQGIENHKRVGIRGRPLAYWESDRVAYCL